MPINTGGGNIGTAASGAVGATGGVYLAPELTNLFYEPIRWAVPFSDQWCQDAGKILAVLVMGLAGWLLGGGAGVLVEGMRNFKVVVTKKANGGEQ